MENIKNFVKEHFYSWKTQLNSFQIEALKSYSGLHYAEINTNLLNNSIPSEKYIEMIKLIDSSLTSTSPKNVDLFRSEKCEDKIEDLLLAFEASQDMGEISYPNFISTSFNPTVAMRHIGIARMDYLNYTYKFFNLKTSPKLQCGYLDEDISKQEGTEDEILFRRSYIVKIKSFNLKDGFDDVIEINGKIETI
ncbi:MAG: ADP-ribosyltransferase [Cetobacterium sp.]